MLTYTDEHLARKVFPHLVGPQTVVAVGLMSKVGHHQGFHFGAARHLANIVESHMTLSGLSHNSIPLGGKSLLATDHP